jgi:hypothetical protein
LVYVPTWDNAAWDPETKQLGAWVMELAPQWLQKAAGVIGDGGGAAAPQTDPVLVRLQQQANLEATQQGMQLAASEEQRAAEAFPLQMQQTQTNIETTEANLQRQILSDKFTVAQSMWDAAQLADQLATAKRRDAANTLASLVDNLVPPGMTSLPGLPGSTMPTVATIDFSQLTQGLSPETDAALKFLGLTGQQTSTALTGLRGLGV